MNESVKPAAAPQPFLEHYPEPGGACHRITLHVHPFRIGRCPSSNYVICSRQVSKVHAEIFACDGRFRIRDLGSTNGTFVNGLRVQESELANGDILHIARHEFRFGIEHGDDDIGASANSITESGYAGLPFSLIRARRLLQELLNQYAVRICYQPIIDLQTGLPHGYEALGRGSHEELSSSPAELFFLADRCNLSSELSRLFRILSVERAHRLLSPKLLFLNVHASEIRDDSLLDSLREAKGAAGPQQGLVVEMHEGVVTEMEAMRRLRASLDELEIGLAYDDFGTGQARLLELIEVPPDYLKLDMGLIRGIERDSSRQRVVEALIRLAGRARIQVIAEGIETLDEARVCTELGCSFGQGFLFGRPESIPSHPLLPADLDTFVDTQVQTPVLTGAGAGRPAHRETSNRCPHGS